MRPSLIVRYACMQKCEANPSYSKSVLFITTIDDAIIVIIITVIIIMGLEW